MLPFIRRYSIIFSMLIIFVLALSTRLGAIKQYVTPDEPIWVMRSINFATALSRGEWAATAQIGHPGVTTMWLGSIGILLKRLADPVASVQAIEWLRHVPALSPDNAEAFKYLGVFLTFARLPVILINALGVVGIFLLACKLFSGSTALLAALLIALDPFIAGLSGLLHVDGLLTTFSTLSVLALLIAISGQQLAANNRSSAIRFLLSANKWFALSGFFAALAFLSKSPAIFLLPFTILVIIVALITKRLAPRSALLGLLSFILCHFTFVFLFYPAMWLDAIGTLQNILGLAAFYSTNAVRPTFFDGQYVLNHGLSFYPTALLYRLSPIVVIGLIGALVAALRYARDKGQPSSASLRERFAETDNLQLATCILLLAFAILFIIFITPVAKKYDRYMLPALPMLIFIAAWGIDQITARITRHASLVTHHSSRTTQYALLIIIFLQSLITFSAWPYLLMNYNPLLGGALEAQKHFAVGWGEGLGAAANWINARPDGLQSTVATAAIPSFAPIFSGRSALIDDRGLEASDYYVITSSERQLNPAAFNELQARGSIIYTIRTGSLDGAWIFDNARAREQAALLDQANPQTDAIITSIDLPISRAYHGAAKLVTLPSDVTGQQIENIFNDLSTHYRRLWIAWSPAASPVLRQQIQNWLSQTADLVSQQNIDTAQIAAYDLRPGQIGRIEPLTVQFGGNFALIGLASQAHSIQAGRSADFDLRWQALNPVELSYSVTLQLIDAQGEVWTAGGLPIADHDQFLSDDWPIGHVAEQSIGFDIPIEAPAGSYGVRVSVDRSDGQRMGLFSAIGNFSGTAPSLTSIEVTPPDQSASALKRAIEYPFTQTWNDQIELLGFDNGPGVAINGDLWTVNLIWRSHADNLPRLKAIWQVFDQNNQKVYELHRPLSSYATELWRTGEIIGARYTLRFPVELPAADYHISIGVADSNNSVLPGGMFTPFDVRLLQRDRSFDRPQAQYPISVTFNDPAITLIGADYPASSVAAGDQLPVSVYWQAAATTDTLYKVFIHFETLDGRVLAQIDSDPQGGGMPTTSWAANQFIPDAYPLTIPADTPPGAYQIVVGLYNPLDGEHLIDQVTGLGHVVLNPPIIIK
jgi:4-amino-4-deoxy-L-arabinose transferase-like glycosyltransferase